jgi:hypothetical protein
MLFALLRKKRWNVWFQFFESAQAAAAFGYFVKGRESLD